MEDKLMRAFEDNFDLIERNEEHQYSVYLSKDKTQKLFRSPKFNYDFNLDTGLMISWGEKFEDDPVFAPAPSIADIEIDEQCTGLRDDGVVCKFCFVSGTKILMFDGSSKNIEDIKEGDKVLSYNESTSKIEINTVENLYNRNYDGVVVNIELEDGTTISATDNHPIYVKDVGWVKAGDLVVGDDVLSNNELS